MMMDARFLVCVWEGRASARARSVRLQAARNTRGGRGERRNGAHRCARTHTHTHTSKCLRRRRQGPTVFCARKEGAPPTAARACSRVFEARRAAERSLLCFALSSLPPPPHTRTVRAHSQTHTHPSPLFGRLFFDGAPCPLCPCIFEPGSSVKRFASRHHRYNGRGHLIDYTGIEQGAPRRRQRANNLGGGG